MNAQIHQILAHEHSADLRRAAERGRLADAARRSERQGARRGRRSAAGRLHRLSWRPAATRA